MKTALLAVSLLLLIAALFGVYRAFSLPIETSVTEQVSLVDYEHQGTFDYLVSLKPSYLYGPEPQEPPPPPPEVMKYPIVAIDRFNFTFDYSFVPDRPLAGTTEEVEVRAAVSGPGSKDKQEIVLVPRTARTGDFTVTFPLDVSANSSADNITISDNISGNEIIITAYVYATFETGTGPVFESFSQTLPMHARGPIVEVEGNLDYASTGHIGELNYEQKGAFDYAVYLRSDSPFGAIVLKPPAATPPAPLPAKTIGPGTPIMSRLIDGMDASFSYRFVSNQAVRKIDETVTIEAVLENPAKWTKTFELVSPTGKTGDFTVDFPVDLEQYSALFDTIQQETGSSAQECDLSIRAKVHTSADTDFGPINEDFTQSISTDLSGDTFVWGDNLTKSVPGAIKASRVTTQTGMLLGLPVAQTRIMLAVLAGLVFVVFVLALLLYLRQARGSVLDRKARQVQKKYKNIIVEIKESPEVKQSETVILLTSLEDLVRTAESLLKPVLHKAEGQRHIYAVFDGTTRYEYHLT
jgi:hypothetical protein